MNLADAEEALRRLDPCAGQSLIYDLLDCYGLPKTSLARLRSGEYNRSDQPGVILWKKRVWDAYLPDEDAGLFTAVDSAQTDTKVQVAQPRFLIARNDEHLVAIDTATGDTLDCQLTDLPAHAGFFLPWTGAETYRSENESVIDTRVAQQLAKLYDEIVNTNPAALDSAQSRRELNIFFSRLLFCFFAEDTGVFESGVFTNTLASLTQADGTDTDDFLDDLFAVLNKPTEERAGVPAHFATFGYVNGSLFAEPAPAPRFTRVARDIIVDCGSLNWAGINPDIFGSMIQAIVATEDRGDLGMHYTSVDNILKVLKPLLLDALERRFDAASESVSRLENLRSSLATIRVFDPACGSGNFLIVAYKRLRSLEHRIIVRIAELDSRKAALFATSVISLDQFYGIEIDDFAHDIATLSLWLAKHQMNVEFNDLFGIDIPLIPLTETGHIHNGNAALIDWHTVTSGGPNTYVCGNPPFVGSKKQTAAHKADFKAYFGGKYPAELDYISLWFLKAADYAAATGAEVGLVATNSVCQGQMTALLWSRLLDKGVEISFAHTSFLWGNKALGRAGVTCVVVGLSARPPERRAFTDDAVTRLVPNINPYLVAIDDNTIVTKSSRPVTERPPMAMGNRAIDNGHLVLTGGEREQLLDADSNAAPFVRPFIGSNEFLNGTPRFCVWVEDDVRADAFAVSKLKERMDAVGKWRAGSTARDTPKWATRPHRFIYTTNQTGPCLVVPRVSTERRQYIPVGFLEEGAIASDRLFVVPECPLWLLALLHSSAHMAWIKGVCGRQREDYSYGNTLGYNTFPFPERLDESAIERLTDLTFEILGAREVWPELTLSDMYDPEHMPENLRSAHDANDAYVDSLYAPGGFSSDAERMAVLLPMYSNLVTTKAKS